MYDVFSEGSNPIDKLLFPSHLEVPDWQDIPSAFSILSMLHKARNGITQHSQMLEMMDAFYMFLTSLQCFCKNRSLVLFHLQEELRINSISCIGCRY